jgi:hypothetical protein
LHVASICLTGEKIMNKTKKVAWHKHLAKAKKRKEKQRAARANSATTPTTTARR